MYAGSDKHPHHLLHVVEIRVIERIGGFTVDYPITVDLPHYLPPPRLHRHPHRNLLHSNPRRIPVRYPSEGELSTAQAGPHHHRLTIS